MELPACHCGLAPQPDLGCVSALIYFPSLISSSLCLPSSLSCAKRHCGPSSSASPQAVRCWYTPTPQALCQPAVVTNPPLCLLSASTLLPGTCIPLPPIPGLTLSMLSKCSTAKLGPSPFICLVNSLKVIELGLVK